jgi:hypothetical protein
MLVINNLERHEVTAALVRDFGCVVRRGFALVAHASETPAQH